MMHVASAARSKRPRGQDGGEAGALCGSVVVLHCGHVLLLLAYGSPAHTPAMNVAYQHLPFAPGVRWLL
jgi:hypothetical protein